MDYEAAAARILTSIEQKQILSQDMLTSREIQSLLEACHNDRDRAFISGLYEIGAHVIVFS